MIRTSCFHLHLLRVSVLTCLTSLIASTAACGDSRSVGVDGSDASVDRDSASSSDGTVNSDAPAVGLVLYATELLADQLVTIGLDGSVTPIGNLGFDDVEEIAYVPSRDRFLGLDDTVGTIGPVRLIEIDPATGVGTLVKVLNNSRAMAGMAYDSETDTIYTIAFSGGLYAIDPETGDDTHIGGSEFISGLTFDPMTRKLYAADSEALWVIDPSDGDATAVGAVDEWVRGLAFAGPDKTLYGLTKSNKLVELDRITADMTEVADLSASISMARGLASR